MLYDYLAPWRKALGQLNSALLLLSLLLLGACSSLPTPPPTGPHGTRVDPTEAGLMKSYRIGVGDSLSISVWKNPDLSVRVTVLPDGTISVPLAGDVKAAGETTETLASKIATVLNDYIRQPKVTVSVTSAASSEYLQRVRVTGAVNRPLSVTYRRGMTVLDVVLQAGGLTPFASPNKSMLYRQEGGTLNVYPVHLYDILNKGRLDTNYKLLPGDILTVPEKSF